MILNQLKEIKDPRNIPKIIGGTTQEAELILMGELTLKFAGISPVLILINDNLDINQVGHAISCFDKNISIKLLPSWDCEPFELVSPDQKIMATRILTLNWLSKITQNNIQKPTAIIAPLNAIIQKFCTPECLQQKILKVTKHSKQTRSKLAQWLANNSYSKSRIVSSEAEYAVRGSIIDVFIPTIKHPLRFDFFDEQLESIKLFDHQSQRTIREIQNQAVVIPACNELNINEKTINNFKTSYFKRYKSKAVYDPLYESLSVGQSQPGIEHWLAYFYPKLESIFSFVKLIPTILPANYCENLKVITENIDEKYQKIIDNNIQIPRKNDLYLNIEEIQTELEKQPKIILSHFSQSENNTKNINACFTPVFHASSKAHNIFSNLNQYLTNSITAGKKCIITTPNETSKKRIASSIKKYTQVQCSLSTDFKQASTQPVNIVSIIVMNLARGFETDNLVVISHLDIWSAKNVPKKSSKAAKNKPVSSLLTITPNDYVVHVEHGIGKFIGIRSIEIDGIPHECVELEYANNDKILIPVGNVELISRYSSSDNEVNLSTLGTSAWSRKKSKLKKMIRAIAAKLIQTEAARKHITVPPIENNFDAYDLFCSEFGYEETEDQILAIDDVTSDLASGKLMERLICGDVGFGKTEVAMRACFLMIQAGYQIVIVVPTTLLAMQHYKTFQERFKNVPCQIRQLSRLQSPSSIRDTILGLEKGTIDILISTHSIFKKKIKFHNLGLIVIDEEQHFGVEQKEILKEQNSNVHLLSLSATPIPRTLNMALTGLRSLSLISSPPSNRLAVKTFVKKINGDMIREALLREHNRKGCSFYIVPRVSDIDYIAQLVAKHTPELNYVIAHGKMPPKEIEDSINKFCSGLCDILICTSIVESGLDIPQANTIIIHKAHMFGLAQLYQLKGRVGRSHTRGYAILSVPDEGRLTDIAQRRLKVIDSQNSLGVGLHLAYHDMDIRGTGNFLGREQSGHVKEIGYELYNTMLEQAVKQFTQQGTTDIEDLWSPKIISGINAHIPKEYIEDQALRMDIYRQLSKIHSNQGVDELILELNDRFGPPPNEIIDLAKIIKIQNLCRKANIEKLETGPNGIAIYFRKQKCNNPAKIAQFVNKYSDQITLKADMSLFVSFKNKMSNILPILAKLVKNIT